MRAKIFVSYSHADSKWLERLQVHLKPLERKGLVELWDDSRIEPSMKWRDEIRRALDDATIAILLVSADFLASDFIAHNELPPLLLAAQKDGATILPVILSPSSFEQTEELNVFQTVNPPSRPLSRLRVTGREAVFADLAKRIHDIVNRRPSVDGEDTGRLEAAPAAAVPSLVTGSLLEELATDSPTDLISRILSRRFTLEQLNAAVESDRDGAAALLHAIARRLTNESDTWLRMLAAQVASRIDDPGAIASAIAFDSSYHWGARTSAITWMRFCEGPERDAHSAKLLKRLKADSADAARLVASGMGFLANTLGLSDVAEEYNAYENSYGNEKLGPYIVRAYLNCYIHHGGGWLPTDVLARMTEMYDACARLGNMQLSEFNFFTQLQAISPGLAVPLLTHLSQNAHTPLLRALMWTLKDRPNRHALGLLRSVVETPATPDNVRHAAVDAIGRIRSEDALAVSLDLAQRYPATWNNGALLSIGTNRSIAHTDRVRDAIATKHASLSTACWALGELAQTGDRSLISLLRQQTEQSIEPEARAIAWLGLAKAGVAPTEAELQEVSDASTSYGELVILGSAAAHTGSFTVLEKAIHSSQRNHAPIWRLEGHLCHDYRQALQSGAGEPGRILLELWRRGDLE